MARTERIDSTKDVTPPPRVGVPRTGPVVITIKDAEDTDDAEDETPAPLPELNSRFGRYVILDKIGQGGMGVVYTAYDHELDRKVALKLLRVHKNAAESVTEGRARLVREAKSMAKLAHPNVVTVHDCGTIDGRVFVAMEYVDGRNMRSWLFDRKHTWKQALDICLQAGRGLLAAHDSGQVHRDFKPDNVLIGNDGRVRVTDFGLARPAATVEIMRGPTGAVSNQGDCLTEPGRIMGTLGYMAPEQTDGRPTDAKMDQFAFCVALYEALTGRRPFVGRTRDDLRDAVESGHMKPWPKKSKVPMWLRKAVERGLEAKPSKRWPSMHDVIAQLERRPLRRRWVAGGVATAAAAAGVWVSLSGASELAGRCEGAEDHLAGVWDDDAKVEARDAILSTGAAHSSSTWDRVEKRIDGYANRWTDMRTEACEATARGEQSGQLLDRRMACLDVRLAELDALSTVLAQADTTVVDKAVWASASLPMLSPCADLDALAAQTTRPKDPAQAEAVEKLRRDLARAQALERVNKPAEGLAIASAALAETKALDHAPLEAEALHVFGALQARMGRAKEAEDNLSEAAMMAAAHEHESVAAAAATEMMNLVGGSGGDYKKGLLWGWYAESAVDRMGERGVEEANMLEGLGTVMASHGKVEEARGHLQRAVDVRRELLGDNHPAVATTLLALGDLSRRTGDLDDAREHYRDALAIQEEALGSLHPDVGGILEKLATVDSDVAGSRGATSHASP